MDITNPQSAGGSLSTAYRNYLALICRAMVGADELKACKVFKKKPMDELIQIRARYPKWTTADHSLKLFEVLTTEDLKEIVWESRKQALLSMGKMYGYLPGTDKPNIEPEKECRYEKQPNKKNCSACRAIRIAKALCEYRLNERLAGLDHITPAMLIPYNQNEVL